MAPWQSLNVRPFLIIYTADSANNGRVYNGYPHITDKSFGPDGLPFISVHFNIGYNGSVMAYSDKIAGSAATSSTEVFLCSICACRKDLSFVIHLAQLESIQ